MPHMLLLWWLLVLLWWLQVKRLLRRSAVVIAQTPSLRQTAQLELILHSWKHVSNAWWWCVIVSAQVSGTPQELKLAGRLVMCAAQLYVSIRETCVACTQGTGTTVCIPCHWECVAPSLELHVVCPLACMLCLLVMCAVWVWCCAGVDST